MCSKQISALGQNQHILLFVHSAASKCPQGRGRRGQTSNRKFVQSTHTCSAAAQSTTIATNVLATDNQVQV